MINSLRQISSTMYGYDRDKHPYNAWVTPEGDIIPTSFTMHTKVAQSIIDGNSEYREEFAKSNKNRGYDAKEFLIISKKFISINQGHFNFSGNATNKQRATLGCDPCSEEGKMDAFFSDMC